MWAEVIQAPWMEEMHPEKQVMITDVFKGVLLGAFSTWMCGLRHDKLGFKDLHPGQHLSWWLPSLRATHCLFGTIWECSTIRPAVRGSTTCWHLAQFIPVYVTCFRAWKILKFPHLPSKRLQIFSWSQFRQGTGDPSDEEAEKEAWTEKQQTKPTYVKMPKYIQLTRRFCAGCEQVRDMINGFFNHTRPQVQWWGW